jgi:hypothetical protein
MKSDSESAPSDHQRLLLSKIAASLTTPSVNVSHRAVNPLKRRPPGAILGRMAGGEFVRGYMSRHQNPWNRALHLVGVPLAPVTFLILLALGHFVWAGAAFVVGYTLQWTGHQIEGNRMWDSWEGQLVKALLVPFQALRRRV